MVVRGLFKLKFLTCKESATKSALRKVKLNNGNRTTLEAFILSLKDNSLNIKPRLAWALIILLDCSNKSGIKWIANAKDKAILFDDILKIFNGFKNNSNPFIIAVVLVVNNKISDITIIINIFKTITNPNKILFEKTILIRRMLNKKYLELLKKLIKTLKGIFEI